MKDDIIIRIFIWVVGVIVALVVGSGMISKTLTVPGIPKIVTFIAGWVVVVSTIISIILTVFAE